MKNKKKIWLSVASAALALVLLLGLYLSKPAAPPESSAPADSAAASLSPAEIEAKAKQAAALPDSLPDIPESDGKTLWVALNENKPLFSAEDCITDSYEYYSELDSLNRCGVAVACIGQDLMPTEERGSIGSVKPTGWQTAKYDIVDGKYLYNRCHLIGFQLTGENANRKNLITGTRAFNVDGMLPFENMVADYVKETGNHVLYRVTPVFEGDELVARGVRMEAFSVEDNGAGILFHVFIYNIQPGICIDYATGKSELDPDYKESASSSSTETFLLNRSTLKYHRADESTSCAGRITAENKELYTGTREALESRGYTACGTCRP